MPYVERNWKGQIVGVYAGPQTDEDGTLRTEPVELPEDHAEVAAFLAQHPAPRPAWTLQDMQRHDAEIKKSVADHQAIANAVAAFDASFDQLEIALSALLYSILNLPGSQLAYAIYFSPTGFGARIILVEDCLNQIAMERAPLKRSADLWRTHLRKRLDRVRDTRNALAHGARITLAVNEKQHARFTAPAFDVKRVGNKIARGEIPGLTAHEIRRKTETAVWLARCVDLLNRLVSEFHEGNPSLTERYQQLERRLAGPPA